MNRNLSLVCCLIGSVSLNANAYQEETHAEILTRQAVNQSVLQSSATLSDLGFSKSIEDTAQKFPDTRGEFRTIRELLEDGSRFEDESILDLGPTNRPLRHFYNPVTGLGLDIPLSST